MKRKLRDSTVAKSDQLQAKLKKRELDIKRRKSRQLIRQAEQNQASIGEAIQLSVVNRSSELDSNSGNKTDTSAKDTTSTEGDIGAESTDEYWYDTSNVELLDIIESPVTPASLSNLDSDMWSSVNRFFPEGCVISPPVRPLARAKSLPTVVFKPSVPVLSVGVEQLHSKSEDSDSPPSPAITVIEMDTINARFKEVKKQASNIDILIERFNADTVNILDKDDYKTELKTIFNYLLKMQDKVSNLQDSLDENVEDQMKINDDVNALFDETKKKVVKNETDVKVQMLKLINDSVSTSVKNTAEVEQKKLTLKIKNATTRFKSLKEEVSNLSDVSDMCDNDIRESLAASKEWKKDLKAFQLLKENLDIEMVTVTIEEDFNTEFQTVYDETVDLVTKFMADLTVKDKSLGLFSLAESKSKSIVQYPEPFGGSLGENVFRFIKEFKDALAGDQVRKADEVKYLIKYLKGNAKTSLGEHHKSLQDALKHLEDIYGCPRLIVEKYTKDYEKALGNVKDWGKHGTKQRIDALNKTADFIRNLESLAADHPSHLKSEIYSKQTLLMLTKGMPHEFTKKLNETCGHADPYEDWIAAVFDILEESKSTNLSALSTGIGAAKSAKEENHSNSKSNHLSHDGHDCSKSSSCRERWDYLGCINLYKVTQISDRESFLRERRACFKCGKSPFAVKGVKRHLCSWKNGKMAARCTGKHGSGGRCYKAAAMCSEHDENASDVLLDWLKTHRITFTVNMILLNHGNLGPDPFFDSMRGKVTQPSQVVAKSRITKQERESLQSGESAINMSDDEIYEFFSSDMRKIQGNAKVQKIPQGEPVFIFCVVQGLHNPIMAFIDSGANFFLSQEGIPENELISVKLQNGPIPLSVASGMTTYASAEYASLLPLANGNYQTVRGLTLRKVTGDMPELDLSYAFEHIKGKCSSNKRI